MKISVDTNILVRVVLQDDLTQTRAAIRLLKQAALVAISLPCLCELVWVLRKGAKLRREEVAQSIHDLLGAANVEMNRPAVEFGLAVLEAGGDFADGILAYEGLRLGGDTFVSFDRAAVNLLTNLGKKTKLLA